MPGGRPSPRGSGSGPRASARRTASGRGGSRPGTGPGRRPGAPRPRATAAREAPPRPRFTGRAAILVLVLAVLMVSYASSMRAYLQQRQHLIALHHDIASSKATIAKLEREKKRWSDPAYVRAVTHERLGWVLPGEIGFQVVDGNDKPLGHQDSLTSPATSTAAHPPIWWKSAWGSMEAAGNPPTDKPAEPPPATRIRAPKNPKNPKKQ